MKEGEEKTSHSWCIGSFGINHKRRTGANMFLFHGVFSENNANLAVAQSQVVV